MGTHSDLIIASWRAALATQDREKQSTGWADRHVAAFNRPSAINGESGIVGMIRSLADYADRHACRFESPIGEDYVLGPIWARMVLCCRELLNGETGNLDCGTLDGLLISMLKAEGFDECGGRLENSQKPDHPCSGCGTDGKPCERPPCKRCGSLLDADGYCTDQTCPYDKVPQDSPVGWDEG